jgi:protein phosphatase 1G
LKSTETYLKGEINDALIEAFMKMDEKIKEPEVMAEIQKIAKAQNGETEGESAVDYEDENVGELYKEATMPLDKLVAKYQQGKCSEEDATAAGCSTSDSPGSSKNSSVTTSDAAVKEESQAGSSKSSFVNDVNPESSSSSHSKVKVEAPCASDELDPPIANGSEDVAVKDSSCSKAVDEHEAASEKGNDKSVSAVPCTDKSGDEIPSSSPKVNVEESVQINGTGKTIKTTISVNGGDDEPESSDSVTADTTVSNGSNSDSEIKVSDMETKITVPGTPKPRKGKVHPSPIVIKQTDVESESKRRSPRKGTGLASLAFGKDSDDDSDLDSSDSDHPAGGVDSSDDDEEGNSSSSNDEDDEDAEEEDTDEDEDDSFLSELQEPGYDSGSTAVVAFLQRKDEKINLWVANAGDSR